VQCEGGYVTVAETGNANIYDNDNKRIMALTKGGNGSHRANFVKAVQNRKVTVGLIEEAHFSSALCHMGNVSYLLGAEKSNAALRESIAWDLPTSEAYGRTLDHLRANDVDLANVQVVKGPLLKFDNKTEMFVGSDQVLVDAANKNPLHKRTGRGAFSIPQLA
jgi:hypothetical protein